MPNEIQPEPPEPPQTTETEADAQAARLVTERLNEITQRANRTRRRVNRIFVLALLCLLACPLLVPFLFHSHKLLFLSFVFLFIFAAYSAFGIALFVLSRGMPKFDAQEMARLGGTQAIAPLYTALNVALLPRHREPIYAALTVLLPQLKASDANLLTPALRRSINTWLTVEREEKSLNAYSDDLRIAALKALEQVGDSSAIPVVERLAEMWPPLRGKRALQQAAIECLPMLRANCGDVETARTLLRASHAADARPDTLLRPASGSGQTGSAELLRGSDSPDAAGDSGG